MIKEEDLYHWHIHDLSDLALLTVKLYNNKADAVNLAKFKDSLFDILKLDQTYKDKVQEVKEVLERMEYACDDIKNILEDLDK